MMTDYDLKQKGIIDSLKQEIIDLTKQLEASNKSRDRYKSLHEGLRDSVKNKATKMLDDGGYTVRQVADKFGVTTSYIYRLMGDKDI